MTGLAPTNVGAGPSSFMGQASTLTQTIPLYRRVRAERQIGERTERTYVDVVAGHALVDADDHARLAAYTWRLSSRGYACRWLNRDGRTVVVQMHREVLGLDPEDRRWGDHINGDKLDNRRANLRPLTPAESRQNTRGHGATGVKNVHHRRDGKYEVRVVLGVFDCVEDAAAVAEAWRAKNQPFSREAACR